MSIDAYTYNKEYNKDLESALSFVAILKTKSLNVDEKITFGILHGMQIQKKLDDAEKDAEMLSGTHQGG